MTDSIARIKARAATRARMDLKGPSASRSGKTRRKVNCKPPNVKCGGRCIPPSWDCRLEGKGTNSELKSHSFDPLGGVASIERGVKTIAKDPLNPSSLDRGRNSIIRGVVKATPGDNLEQKKKLKRNLQKYGNQIGAVMLLGAGAIGAHQAAKRLNSRYARGLGRSIDMAAFGAVDAVLDRTPIVGGQRAAARAGGLAVARQLGRGLAIEANNETALARSLTNSGRIGGLGAATVRGNFQNSNVLAGQQNLQRLVRGVDTAGQSTGKAKMTFDTWRGQAAKALYGAKVPGAKGARNSAYSDDAANRLISGQFGLRVNNAFQAAGQTARTQASRNEEVRSALSTRLRGFGDTMRADMEVRRFERGKNGEFTAAAIKSYVDTQVIPSMGLSRGGMSASQQNTARRKARSLAIDILSNGTEQSYRTQARTMRAAVVGEYNNYFSEAADRMSLPGASRNSTFGDGQVGLARYVMKQGAGASGRVVPIKSRSHADLILKDHFTRKVQGKPNGTFTASASTVQRVAQQLNGGTSLPDKASAYSIVQESGIKSLRSPSEAPSTGRRTKAKAPAKSSKGGLGGQRSQSDLARSIMKRSSFKGTYAEALAQARRELKRSEAPSTGKRTKAKAPSTSSKGGQRSQSDPARKITQRSSFKGSYEEGLAGFLGTEVAQALQARREMKRSDAAEVRDDLKKSEGTGKPCGESYIPKSHECSKTSSGRSAGYRARQVGSAALRVAAIPGGVALAAGAIKFRKHLGPQDRFTVPLLGLAVSAGAVQSLRNERRSTKTPEQFASDIRKLSKMPDADPAIVNQVAAFTEEAGIDQQRVGIMLDLNGIKGYFDSGKPNRLSANEKSRKGMSDEDYQLLGKALQDHNEFRKSLSPRQQDARYVRKTLTAQKRNHGPISQLGESKDLQNSYGTYIKVHELGHAVHYRGGFKTASSVNVNGKTYAGQELERELMKSVGIYGQSDIRRSRATRENYYSQGNRLETYAENFALYTLSGKAMKRDFPVAYEWTKQTTDNALRQPVKKDPAPFAELIATEGYKGFGTFDPTKGRKDADDAKGDWYSQLQDAAAAGELANAMKIFAANGKGMTEIEIGIALQWIEAASVTKVAKREMKRSDAAEARNDAKKSQGEGKPCGNSYIAKSFKCGKKELTNKTTKEQTELTKIQKVAIAGGLSVTAAVGLALIAKGRLNPPNSSFRNKLQNDALAEYVTDSSYLNRELRSGKPKMSEMLKAEIDPIDNWFQTSQPTTGTYYRGIHSQRTMQFLSQAKVGDSYVDKGYGSFSQDLKVARLFTAGRKDIYILRARRAPLYRIPVEQFPFKDELNEKEYLSPRNSRFKISKIETSDPDSNGRKYITIDLTYLGSDAAEARKDAKKSQGAGKPCGESHIPRTHTCNVGHNKVKTAVKVAIGTSAVIGTAYLLKKYAFTPKDAAEFAKAKPYRVGKSVKEGLEGLAPLGKGADGAVYLSADGKYAFKQVHDAKRVMKEVTNQLRAQAAGVKTATITAYDAEKGIIKMEALTNHKPLHAMQLGAKARHQAAVSLMDNIIKLHSKGMHHADIRGNNILVDQTGDTRLIDFARSGLSVSEATQRSEVNSVITVMKERNYITEATSKKAITELNRSRRQLHGNKAITHAEALKRVTHLINRDRNK